MTNRLVAIDEGTDILLDRKIVFVGRSPQCDVRLDSLRVSRHHCCMTTDRNEVHVRDLGSTNGIRINGHRVESGLLKANDELSIAHIRYRLDNGQSSEATLADTRGREDFDQAKKHEPALVGGFGLAFKEPVKLFAPSAPVQGKDALEALRDLLQPGGMADRCLIQVIVQKPEDVGAAVQADVERHEACRPESSP